MFSCCRCVNPKSPKYKRKNEKDDDSPDHSTKDLCPDDNPSSEEEIKVEIIETDGKPVGLEAGAEKCDYVMETVDETDTFPASAVPVESADENHQLQQQHCPGTSPERSSTSSEHQQSTAEASETNINMVKPTCPDCTEDSSTEKIPTTIAETIENAETPTTTIDPNTEVLENEKCNIIIEPIKDSANSPTNSESMHGEIPVESEGNDVSRSSDTDNMPSESLEPVSEIEILPVAVQETLQQSSENPDECMTGLDQIRRLKSDTSYSQATIEETIDIQSYLSTENGTEQEKLNRSGEYEASNNSGSNNSEIFSEDNHVPETAAAEAANGNEKPTLDTGTDNGDGSCIPNDWEPNEQCSPAGNRKQSANSDDTPISTQLSHRGSCLSRRSSSKSSIKKKVAYNDSTEIIPPPDYTTVVNDDDEVFSDSIPPRLPRGNMCAPYSMKRGSIPGLVALPDWFAEERLIMEDGGIMEPPTTPIGRDELALRRHRFFSDLLNAAHAAVEHRVRFDPLGPIVAKEDEPSLAAADCDPDLKPSSARELEHLIDRLERIVDRLERTVSARELEETRRILKDVCDAGKIIVSDTVTHTEDNVAADEDTRLFELTSNSDLPTVLPSTPPPSASYLHQQLDSLEATLFPELTPEQTAAVERQPSIEDSLPTVISQVVLDNSNSSNNSNDQEQNSVLETTNYLPPDDDFGHPKETANKDKMSVNAYEDIILGSLANFLALSNKIGGDVAAQAELVKQAFNAQFSFVRTAAECSAPSNNDLQSLLKPTSDQIAAIQSYREKHRTSQYFNHLSAISESIPALGWVCVAPTPGPYVKEMNDAGQFYTNRVLKDWKEKDSTHVEWARAWIQTLTELQQYIKQHHTTGLVWAGKNKPATGGSAIPPPPPPGGLPPPPPMMPLGDLSGAGVGDDRSALFAQINQGEDITKGLKKVTSDMQTHKNPGIRSGPAPYKAPAGITNGTKTVSAPASVAKPPSFTRDGKKWLIEYQKGNSNLVVENAEMNNVVYMFRCENSTLQIKGKINSVVMDSCKKCSLVFDSLVASAEFVNCQSVQMQVLGKVPTISIDKTDGCQMYLSADSLDVEIVSSKSSEMNVMIPKGTSGDYTEQPIPEQFKTTIKGQNLTTTFVESLG